MEVVGVRFNEPSKRHKWTLSAISLVLVFGEDKIRIADIILGKNDRVGYFIKWPTHRGIDRNDGSTRYYSVAHSMTDATYDKVYRAIVSEWERKEEHLE